MARAEISKTPPGPLGGRGPLASSLWYWRRGTRSHLGLISPGWGLSLRLLRYSSWGQCRLCLCRQVRRVSICSPGSAYIISLGGTEPDLGPVVMTSTGTNHGCGLVVLQGQSRARENGSGWLWSHRRAVGLKSLDRRGARLRWSTTQVHGCCAGQECCARRDAVAQGSAATAVGSGGGPGLGGTSRAALGGNESQGTGRA